MAQFAGFPPEMAAFFRGLKKNNDREWFTANKETFETKVKAPMTALVEALNEQIAKTHPSYVTEPKRAIFRIHRDTRFSKDKTPYKDHIGASFSPGRESKFEMAGLYVGVSDDKVEFGGGLYMVDPAAMLTIRTLLAERHAEFRRMIDAKPFRTQCGPLLGDKLTRAPKGFPADHPAEELLRHKQWYFFVEQNGAIAQTPKLLTDIAKRFATVLPALDFLNEPLLAQARKKERSAKMLA